MALMTVQADTGAGAALTFGAANTTDTISGLGDGRTALIVKNGAGAPINVTITSQAAARAGLAQANKVVAVANGATTLIVIDPAGFSDNTGTATVTYSSVTTITSAAVKI